jgi:hypothetical protein
MNHSIATADRNTHLKVAALALVAAILFLLVGFSAHVDDYGCVTARMEGNGPAVKPSKVTQFTARFGFEVR